MTVVRHDDVEIVIVATTHDSLAAITQRRSKRASTCWSRSRRPAAPASWQPVVEAADRQRVLSSASASTTATIRAFRKAREIVDDGARRADVRARTLRPRRTLGIREGVAGRMPAISGGGELIDQGVHLIDLSRWFLGDFTHVDGTARTYFWNMAVDDNGFLHAPHRPRPGRLPARELHRVEEPVLVRRSTAATASSRSTAWAAATASSA